MGVIMGRVLTREVILSAFQALSEEITKTHRGNKKVILILGGGGAMVLAHSFPLATADVDAAPKGLSLDELDVLVKKVSKTLGLSPDWLNPYFSRFAIYLPEDFSQRLIKVFTSDNLEVMALGKEDMLILKSFAHRAKDIPHARALVKQGADIGFVEKHIEKLKKNKIPQAQEALEFLDQIVDES